MRVFSPISVEEACDTLAQRAESPPVPIAGATDLFVHWPERLETRDRDYLDLSQLHDLRPMRWTDDELILGALTTYWDVVQCARCRSEFPLLERAARQVGAVQIQARGTWAGNIVNASPAADGAPVLMAYDAIVTLQSSRGVEHVPLSEFYLDYKKMRRTPDQLVTAIRIPRRAHDFHVFEKVGPRRAQAIAKVGLAMTHSAAGWRIVAASMAPTVRRCRAVEELLESGAPVRSPDDLLPAIRRDVSPIDDIRSTARYRETVMARLIYHDLKGFHPSFT